MFAGCPWCERVRAAIDDLGIVVEERDVRADPEHAAVLQSAMGHGTVPVLRTDTAEGPVWLPESTDIVRHLYATYGAPGQRPTWIATNVPNMLGLGLAISLLLAGLAAPERAQPWLIAAAAVAFALRNSLPLVRRIL